MCMFGEMIRRWAIGCWAGESYFDDAVYRRFDFNGRPVAVDATTDPGRVRRRGALNATGTSQEAVIDGSFRASDGDSALYSSLGHAFTVPQGARTPPTPMSPASATTRRSRAAYWPPAHGATTRGP